VGSFGLNLTTTFFPTGNSRSAEFASAIFGREILVPGSPIHAIVLGIAEIVAECGAVIVTTVHTSILLAINVKPGNDAVSSGPSQRCTV